MKIESFFGLLHGNVHCVKEFNCVPFWCLNPSDVTPPSSINKTKQLINSNQNNRANFQIRALPPPDAKVNNATLVRLIGYNSKVH